jgi:hypothetical protein
MNRVAETLLVKEALRVTSRTYDSNPRLLILLGILISHNHIMCELTTFVTRKLC